MLLVIFLLAAVNEVVPQHKNHKGYPQTQPSDWIPPMEMDVRSMHRFCSGECFFVPQECTTEEQLQYLNCRNIVSIKKYKPPCEEPTKPSLVELCKRQGHLYMVSILRNVHHDIVRSRDRTVYKKAANVTLRCILEPFVAISFTDDNSASVVPSDLANNKIGDVFYTCVANEYYVTSWVKPVEPPIQRNSSCLNKGTKIEFVQLVDTNPYPQMGASVLWSKITMKPDQYAIGCKFIISDEESDLTVKINNQLVTVPVFQGKKLKIANGIAYIQNEIVEEVFFSTTTTKVRGISSNLMDDASLVSLEGIPDWNSPLMNAPEPLNASFLSPLKSNIAQEAMNGVYDKCLRKKAMCFTRKDERSCILRRNCHFLASIRSLDSEFTTVRFNIISQHAERKGIVFLTHPQSWAAIAFSNDTKMGKDIVFGCVYRGTTQRIIRGYNANQMFIQQEPKMMEGQEPGLFVHIKSHINMDSESTMCVFDMSTEDIIQQAFYYSNQSTALNDINSWTELYWSLKNHEFFVLLAQGTTMFDDGVRGSLISYHTYRCVSEHKFSRQLYLAHVNRATLARTKAVTLLLPIAIAFLKIIGFY